MVFVKNGLYYEYKEKRDPESVFRFAYQDYKNLEGEPIPMEGSFWRSAYKSLGKVKEQKRFKLINILKLKLKKHKIIAYNFNLTLKIYNFICINYIF